MPGDLPKWSEYYVATVRALRALGGSGTNRQIETAVARALRLTPQQLRIPYKQDHRTRFQYELAWTRTRLRLAGLVSNPARGKWSLTDLGKFASDDQLLNLESAQSSEATSLPRLPDQTAGPKFAMGPGGLVFADSSGQAKVDRARSAALLGVARETALSLSSEFDQEKGLWPAAERALSRYAATLSSDPVNYGRLFGEGIILANAIQRAKEIDATGNAYPLTDNAAVLGDSLMQMHAALMMSSTEGRSLVVDAQTFSSAGSRTKPSVAEAKLAEALLSETAPVSSDVQEHIKEIGSADMQPGLRRAYLGATVRNASIVLTASAVAVIALQLPGLALSGLAGAGYLLHLVGSEAIKKSKLGKLASEKLASVVDWTTVRFVEKNQSSIRKLAEDQDLAGLTRSVDWLTQHSLADKRTTEPEGNTATKARHDARRVLVVESDPKRVDGLKDDLKATRYQIVATARNRAEALASLAAVPDMIIAETVLASGESGVDVVVEILKTHPMPTVFVTSYPERLLSERRPEPTYLVTRPYSTTHLLEALDKATISYAP